MFRARRPRRLAAVGSLREHRARLRSLPGEPDEHRKPSCLSEPSFMSASADAAGRGTHHRLFDVLLVVVAAGSVVIAVHDLNSDVALGETSAPFT